MTSGFLTLDSNYVSSGSISQGVFNLSSQVANVKTIGLSHIDLSYCVPNINLYNQTDYIETSTLSYPVTLATGTYIFETLRVEIEAKLGALGLGVFTVTLLNNRYHIAAPVPVRFIHREDRPMPYGGARWGDVAGFSMLGNTYQFNLQGGVAPLVYSRRAHFSSRVIESYKDKTDEFSGGRLNDIIGSISLIGGSYSHTTKDPDAGEEMTVTHRIEHTFQDIKWIKLQGGIQLRSIDVGVYDDYGNPFYEETGGSNLSYILTFLDH